MKIRGRACGDRMMDHQLLTSMLKRTSARLLSSLGATELHECGNAEVEAELTEENYDGNIGANEGCDKVHVREELLRIFHA